MKRLSRVLVGAGVAVAPLVSALGATAYDPITAEATWGDTIVALGVIAAAIAFLLASAKGMKMLLKFIS